MFTAVKSFVTERRQGLVKVAGVVGGLYVARRYVVDRLDDAKERMEQERTAQDILKRRFQQNQDDISFTILAVLPTMAEQILDEMNVEAITQEIQRLSKERNAARQIQQRLLQPSGLQSPPHPHRFDPSLSSSVDLINDQDARSDTHSVRSLSTSGEDPAPASGASSPPSVSSSIVGGLPSHLAVPGSSSPAGSMSDSITSLNTDTTSARSKAELWNEVKILTLTRTLTTVYSITLLSLLTSLQLTLLARSKYIHSVLEDEREERFSEDIQAQYSWSNLLLGLFRGSDESSIMGTGTELGGGLSWEELMAQGSKTDNGDLGLPLGGGKDVPKMRAWEKEWFDKVEAEVKSETQSKYLTMSWWILHVGWKDLKERVRRGVEEVFEGVSLKSKLSAIDLHRLVRDVRRRVEHEVTFEGTEKRTNFLSSLLPQTPETIQHVLVQGGFKPSYPAPSLVYPSISPLNPSSPYVPPSSFSQDGHEHDHDHDPSSKSDISGPTSMIPPSSSSMYAPSSSSFSMSQSISVEPSPSMDAYLPAHLQNNYTHPDYFTSESFKRVHQADRGRSKSRDKGKERETTRERSQSLSSMHSHPVDPHHPSHFNQDPYSSLQQHSHALRPHPNARQDSDPTFTRLLMETRQTIQSEDFGYVLEVALDQATDVLFEGLEKNVFVETAKGVTQGGAEDGANVEAAEAEVRIRFAGLLPGLARWSRLTMETVPNEFVDKLLGIREVECLSAIVFGKFEDQF
ncbi:hypothetical protein BDN72DRAFT_903955 [Pluteus cervinus]|uniref:Uncharacterized protein n=1 Tax=Pluteus cervinus TaxID=181527 RepID=A0ACD3A7F1_9AGAR|nr:hypothetical protein BDN72DRAFT_903955 [Pluteus cervinus]